MLMPTLQNSINVAKSIHCQSNLKQVGLAFSMYSSDYKNYIMIFNAWSDTLSNLGYMEESDAMVCPLMEPYKFVNSSYTYGFYARWADSSFTARCCRREVGQNDNNSPFIRYAFDSSYYKTFISLSKVNSPSKAVSMFDTVYLDVNDGKYHQYSNVFLDALEIEPKKGYPHMRHNMAINAVYLDGHASSQNSPVIWGQNFNDAYYNGKINTLPSFSFCDQNLNAFTQTVE